jgi:small subunit ribosomal protein S19
MSEEKVFKFKGKTLEELKEMSLEDFSMLISSRARRKVKRGFSEQEKKLLSRIEAGDKKIKTHCRDLLILPSMVNMKIGIYNGKEFVDVTIAPETLGMRLGELVMTRKVAVHTSMGSKKTVVRK